MSMHNFRFAGEYLQTTLTEGLKEKQKSHEKLAHTKKEYEKNTRKLDTFKVVDEVNRSQSEPLTKLTRKRIYMEVKLSERTK